MRSLACATLVQRYGAAPPSVDAGASACLAASPRPVDVASGGIGAVSRVGAVSARDASGLGGCGTARRPVPSGGTKEDAAPERLFLQPAGCASAQAVGASGSSGSAQRAATPSLGILACSAAGPSKEICAAAPAEVDSRDSELIVAGVSKTAALTSQSAEPAASNGKTVHDDVPTRDAFVPLQRESDTGASACSAASPRPVDVASGGIGAVSRVGAVSARDASGLGGCGTARRPVPSGGTKEDAAPERLFLQPAGCASAQAVGASGSSGSAQRAATPSLGILACSAAGPSKEICTAPAEVDSRESELIVAGVSKIALSSQSVLAEPASSNCKTEHDDVPTRDAFVAL